MSWLLHRVDDRLIHGQVLVAWGASLRPRRIWVVDDAAAGNAWERELLGSAAPEVDVRVLTVSEAATDYAAEASSPGGAFLLVRDLRTAWALVEAGLPIASFNLGGLHYAPGKVKVNDYVYLNEEDRILTRRLLQRGVTLSMQDVPAAKAESLTEPTSRTP